MKELEKLENALYELFHSLGTKLDTEDRECLSELEDLKCKQMKAMTKVSSRFVPIMMIEIGSVLALMKQMKQRMEKQ